MKLQSNKIMGYFSQSLSFVPCHVKMCLQAYADSDGPDQPVHSCSLIRALTVL